MSQHPHDEFDDVPPYQSGEVGKHRASGGGAGRSGGLKWIGLLAAVVLVVGLFSLLVFGDDDDAETTAGEEGVTEEQEDAPEGEGEEGDAEGQGEGQDEGQGEAAQQEEGQEETEGEVDMETPVQIFNHNGPGGTAANAETQLEEQGYNVTALNNWEWGAQTTPVIYHSAEDAEFAQQLASDMGIDNLQESDQFTTVAVVVGEEYAPGQ